MRTPRVVRFGAFLALIALGCGGHRAAVASQPAAEADAAKAPLADPAVPAAPPAAPTVAPCSLVSAAEVGAIVGKSVVSQVNGDGCEYSLDPSAAAPRPPAGTSHPNAGGAPDLMSALGQGGDFSKLAGAVANQLLLTLTVARDGMSEARVRAIYERTGETVRGATQPVNHGLGEVIRPGGEIAGVGDWAFATHVASVNMGFGFSSTGRILEAGKGPWHVTLTVNVSPDPGPEALDRQLAAVARAACAKLPS